MFGEHLTQYISIEIVSVQQKFYTIVNYHESHPTNETCIPQDYSFYCKK